MGLRIYSLVGRQATIAAIGIAVNAMLATNPATAQSGAGYYTDPATGVVYQQVQRTIERPVVETKVETREQTVYRPQTVTESKPYTRTVYTPVVEYKWEPRVHGRWNPFRQPTVAYHHVPQARWERQDEIVQRQTSRTEWVAERRSVNVPTQIVRMEREQQVHYQPVGEAAPAGAPPAAADAIASRLRPLDSNTRVVPFGSRNTTLLASSTLAAPRIASTSVGRLASDPPRRSAGQGGMPTTNLAPNVNVHAQPLPPASSTIATPSLRMFR